MRLLICSLCVLVARSLVAQDPVTAQAEASPKDALAKSLEGLAAGSWRMVGKVSETKPDGEMGMGGMVLVGGPAKPPKPFRGGLEVMRTDRGELLCVSERDLPGIALYRRGDNEVTRTTTGRKAIGMKEIRSDLLSVLDVEKLVKGVNKAKSWETAKSEEDGTTTYEGTIPASLVEKAPSSDGPMGLMGADFMREKVLRVKAAFTLDRAGTVQSFKVTVVRSDPMATMRILAEESGGMFDPTEMEDVEPEEGVSAIYELTRSKSPPSPRAQALLKNLRAVTDFK